MFCQAQKAKNTKGKKNAEQTAGVSPRKISGPGTSKTQNRFIVKSFDTVVLEKSLLRLCPDNLISVFVVTIGYAVTGFRPVCAVWSWLNPQIIGE